MLRLSRLILAREGRGNKNTSITSPPESDFFRWCDNAEDEVNIFDWEPVEEIIQERIQQFKKDAENMKLQVNINDIESTKILVEDDDGDECEYEVSDIAVFSVDKKRNEYCLDMIEYPDLLKPVEKVLHATFGNTIQISKDQRKKKLFCRQPKVNGVVREMSQFKLPLLSVANLTPASPYNIFRKKLWQMAGNSSFCYFCKADFTAASPKFMQFK